VGLTQQQLAETLEMTQGDLSRLERRSNLQLTTLARFIEATGGRLMISAVYGDTQVVLQIGDLADLAAEAGTAQPDTSGADSGPERESATPATTKRRR
jgi:transcriptional regulator with XRE-family HTH domain